MKKLVVLVVSALFMFVAGVQTLAERLTSLPVGNDTVVSNQIERMTSYIEVSFYQTTNTPSGINPVGTASFIPYNVDTNGPLIDFMFANLKSFAEYWVNSDMAGSEKPRMTERKFRFYAVNSGWAQSTNDEYFGFISLRSTNDFSFTVGADGKFYVPSEAMEIPSDIFQTYEAIRAPGVKWVEVVALNNTNMAGNKYMSYNLSRNGPTSCPALTNMYGLNDRIYLPTSLARMNGLRRINEILDPGLIAGAYINLYYDEAMTDYDRFDLWTGNLIESTAPPPPPTIVISPLGNGQMEISVTTSNSNVVIEYSVDNINWLPLPETLRTMTIGAIGKASFVDDTRGTTMRLYRAKVVSVAPTKN